MPSGTTAPIDGLVNNAGIIRRADAVDFTETDWDDVMDVNLKIAVLSQPGLRAPRPCAPARRGKIVNIASVLSFQGGIKRRLLHRREARRCSASPGCSPANGRRKGINVNAIAPGYIETNNTQALRADPDRSAAILGRIPAGRWGEPADIGDAAVFLLARPRTTCMAPSCRSTAAGSRDED